MADPNHLALARSGNIAWNAWRRTHPSVCADFSGTDFTASENRDIVFSGFEFGDSTNFTKTIFGPTPIGYQKFGRDPSRGSANGAALFEGASFGIDANFCGAHFGDYARFDGAVFGMRASFIDTTFDRHADFSGVVFGSASFNGASFKDNADFSGTLFIDGPSFEQTEFGNKASFEGASFERANFGCSALGHNPTFKHAVFAQLVQFEYAIFGDHAAFKGTAFNGSASFDVSEFGDRANFEAGDPREFNEAAVERAKSLPEAHRELYLNRAKAADPTRFNAISFSGAKFGSEDFHRDNHGCFIGRILRWPRSLLRWSPYIMRSFDPGPGVTFGGRTLHDVCDFSRVRFDQPPDFGGVAPIDKLDLAGAVFSFRAFVWPRWQHWTTQTATASRLRRLRKLAKDIPAGEAERDLFILELMADRGIEWSAWWIRVVQPWDLHRKMQAKHRAGILKLARRSRLGWLSSAAAYTWFALVGIGRPIVLTTLVLLYRVLSNYGRSVALPIFWFIVSLLAFGILYGKHVTGGMHWKMMRALATFTIANAIPFVGASGKAVESSSTMLFSGGLVEVHSIALAQGIVSAILLFLAILALRNRFRIS
jgi:uncharacterized protein YjbI with pentapeptide repeats